jgi:cardiolipin synthase
MSSQKMSAKVRLLNVPNGITVFRIFLVPVVIWLIISDQMQWAFFALFVAGVSDALDGYLAKKFGLLTELGAYLDPLADKALLVSIYIVLGLSGHLPVWLVIAVVSRDLLIIGAIMLSWMLERPVKVRPLFVSKVNTTLQIVLAGLVMANLAFGLGLGTVNQILIWITGTLTVASAAAYLVTWLRHMAINEVEAEPVKQPEFSSSRRPARREERAKETARGS